MDHNLKKTCNNIIRAYEAGQRVAACTALYNLLKEKPEESLVQQLHCLILFKERLYLKANVLIQKIIQEPSANAAHFNLCGLISLKLHNFEFAKQCHEKAIAKDANFFPAYNDLGIIYRYLGEKDKAISCFKKSLKIRHNDSASLYNLSCIKSYHFESKELKVLQAFPNKTKSAEENARAYFALYNEYSKLNKHPEAYDYLVQGNKLIFDSQHYEYSFYSYVNRIKKNQNAQYFEKRIRKTKKTKSPVFIVGMPRSGSSLLEQMLDSHSKIKGLGESSAMLGVLNSMNPAIKNNAKEFLDFFNKVAKKDIDASAKDYKNNLGIDYRNASLFLDKSLENFKFIGFIKILFPHAKFIHIKRSPMDTCFACFEKKFTQGHEYSYDLNTLADYYLYYDLLMRHWKKLFPDDIYDIQYEQLVNNPKPELKGCLNFLDLKMEDGCLEFYKNKRIISTSSADQVREKLFTSSIQKWKLHSAELSEVAKKFLQFGIDPH